MQPPTSAHYRPDIDGLRAIAVLSVVCFHTGLDRIFGGGFIGVDVFFVISGYLITRQILERLRSGRTGIGPFLLWFYERRMRRILPAYVFASVATTVMAALVFTPRALEEFGRSLLASALFSANIFFWMRSGYFAPDAASQPLLHFWSLGVEEHFYIVFPLLMYGLWQFGIRGIAVALASLTVLSLIAASAAIDEWPTAVFYWIHFRAWELLAGGLLALPFVAAPSRAVFGALAAALGVALIAASVAVYSANMTFPGLAAVPPVAGSVLIIWGGLIRNPASRFLGIRPAAYVGLISYSLYLVHWPVIVFVRQLFPDMPFGWQTALELPIAFGLAIFSYHFIETPTRRNRAIWTGRRILAFSTSGIGALGAVALAVMTTGGMPYPAPADVRQIASYDFDYAKYYREGSCFLRPEQSFDDLDENECLNVGRPFAVLWGDSYAAHYSAQLGTMIEDRGYRFAQMNASACAPVVGRPVSTRPHCLEFNDRALKWILNNRPRLVIMSAHWPYDLKSIQLVYAEIAKLTDAGIPVIALGQSPLYDAPVPALLVARKMAGNRSNVSAGGLDETVYDSDKALRAALADMPLMQYVSVLDIMCPDRKCPMFGKGVPYHWDQGHLTDVGAQAFVRRIFANGTMAARFLDQMLPKRSGDETASH